MKWAIDFLTFQKYVRTRQSKISAFLNQINKIIEKSILKTGYGTRWKCCINNCETSCLFKPTQSLICIKSYGVKNVNEMLSMLSQNGILAYGHMDITIDITTALLYKATLDTVSYRSCTRYTLQLNIALALNMSAVSPHFSPCGGRFATFFFL